MNRFSEWAMGWKRVAKFTVVCSSHDLAVEKTAVTGCCYALPSVKDTAKPRTPPEEELRFWLAYQCKVMRYIDTLFPVHSYAHRGLISLLADHARDSLGEDWALFDPEEFAATKYGWSIRDNVVSPSARWSGLLLAKGGRLRLVQTVFPLNLDPMCVAASSCAFLKQAATYNEPNLIVECLRRLSDKLDEWNPLPLSGVGGIANAVWIESVMSS
jgi:hypothetical protein